MPALIEKFFAIPVLVDTIDKSIIDNSHLLAKKFINNNNWNTSIDGKTITTYNTDPDLNFLGKIKDLKLLNEINIKSRELLRQIGIDPNIDLRVESWLNLNTPGTYHNQHEHFGSILSGVVYLEVANDSGDLIFHDPVRLRTQANSLTKKNRIELNQFNYQVVRSVPAAGKIVIFESWITHAVETNQSKGNRISVAFNIY